jgi:hypothetical protein
MCDMFVHTNGDKAGKQSARDSAVSCAAGNAANVAGEVLPSTS